MGEVPAVLTVKQLAELCDQTEEWCEERRYVLPCSISVGTGEMTVARGDLPVWLEAAAPKRERRDPMQDAVGRLSSSERARLAELGERWNG